MQLQSDISTHLAAIIVMTQRSLRYDDNPMSSCVTAAEGRREGTLLPFSLPRVSVTRVATPCRSVFQLLKQPHIGFAFNTANEKQEHRGCYFYEISRALFLFDTRIIKMSIIAAAIRITMSLISVSFKFVLGEDANHKSNTTLFSASRAFAGTFIKALSQI